MTPLRKYQRKAVRTPRVKFYLEHRKDKDGNLIEKNVPVIFSVSYGDRYKSFTGYRADKNQWDKTNQRFKASHSHATRLNKALSDLRTELEGICYDAWDRGDRITPAYISEHLKKNQQSARDLFQYLDQYIEEGKKKWAGGSVTKFSTLKKHLEDFGEKFRLKIAFDSMDKVFFNKLADYYLDERKFHNPYVKKNFSFIKSFLIWAEDQGFNKNKEYRKYCKLETGRKKQDSDINIIALSIREFLAIYKYMPGPEMHKKAKDYIILASATGLRYSDIANLKKSDIDYKAGLIKCVTIKTGDTAIIPFNEFSRVILNKYRDKVIPRVSDKADMAIPCMSNQKMNKALKELAENAGVNENVTRVKFSRNNRIEEIIPKYKLISTHTGRKTFITLNVFLGVKSEITMGMTAHSDHEMMEQYYKIDTDMKRGAMKQFTLKNLEKHI